MKKGDHKGLGGNTRRTERKRNRYATSLERRDRDLSKQIARLDDAKKAAKNHDEVDQLDAERARLMVKLRRVERLAKGCRGKAPSALAAIGGNA